MIFDVLYSNTVIGATNIAYAVGQPVGGGGGGGGDGIGAIEQILNQNPQVKVAIKTCFWVVMGFFAIMFAIRAVASLIAYFRGDDERDRKEAKQKAINNAIGVVLCLLSGPIANFLLGLAGLSALF